MLLERISLMKQMDIDLESMKKEEDSMGQFDPLGSATAFKHIS